MTNFDPSQHSFRPCRVCRTPIAFVKTANDKLNPVEADGTPHWQNCPGARQMRKDDKPKAPLFEEES